MFEDVIKLIDVILKADEEDKKKELKKIGYVNIDETIEMINNIENKFVDTFDEALDVVSDEIDENIDINNINEYMKSIQDKINDSKLDDFMKKEYEDKIIRFGNSYLKQNDKDLFFNTPSKFTSKFVNEWSENLIKSTNEETVTSIRSVLQKGVNDGSSIEEIALNISSSHGLSRERARTIALNETLRAHSYARNEAAIQNPSVVKYMWRHSGTKGISPRKVHIDLDGTVIEKGKYFDVNGYDARFPRDTMLPAKESVNCHCTFEEIINEDILGLSLEDRQKLQEEAIAEIDKKEGKDE